MESLSRIGMLVEMRAVEIRKAMLIRREMRRHPVEYDADAVLMQDVDHVHQILRRAVTAGGCKKACDLITPRSIERMLHHRHQLDVREIHLANVFRERSGEL